VNICYQRSIFRPKVTHRSGVCTFCTRGVTQCRPVSKRVGVKPPEKPPQKYGSTFGSTMGTDRLNGFALLNIHRDVRVDAKSILDKLAEKPRRLPLRLQ